MGDKKLDSFSKTNSPGWAYQSYKQEISFIQILLLPLLTHSRCSLNAYDERRTDAQRPASAKVLRHEWVWHVYGTTSNLTGE